MPSPTIFSYALQDAAGVKGSHSIYVAYNAATETVGALLAAAAQYGALLDAVTGAKVLEFNVNINALPDPAWKDNAIADIDMEQTLLMNYVITDSKYSQPYDVPALRDTLIDTDGRPIYTTGAIAALVDAITGATGLGAVSVNSQFLLDLTGLRDISVTFRKHRKGRKAVSKVIVE
ncbi:MAG TPA: hypothetical protein V6C97_21755 [Oculatellaceae cyanobacterium]